MVNQRKRDGAKRRSLPNSSVPSQENLKGQTKILQSILTSLGDGLIVVDGRGNLLTSNPAAAEIVNMIRRVDDQAKIHLSTPPRTKSSSNGQNNQYGFFKADGVTPYPPEESPLEKAIKGQFVRSEETFLRCKTYAEGIWLSVTATPLQDVDGFLHGGITVFRDIAKRKRTEEAERIRTQELEALFNIATTLVQSGNYAQKATRVLEELDRVFQADSAMLWVPDRSDEVLRLIASAGANAHRIPPTTASYTRSGSSSEEEHHCKRLPVPSFGTGQADTKGYAIGGSLPDHARRRTLGNPHRYFQTTGPFHSGSGSGTCCGDSRA